MPKSWKQILMSHQYKQLSPKNKVDAKKSYWTDVVNQRSEFQSLSSQDKNTAQQQFFGGRLIEEVPQQKINIPLETAKGTARVIGKSAGKLGSAMITPIRHPIQTAKGLGGLAVGTAQKLIPGRQAQERYPEALGQEYKKRYGGVENIAETVATDPFAFLSDVALAGGVAGGALKTAGKLGKVPALTRAGQAPLTTQTVAKTGQALRKTSIGKMTFPTKAQRVNNVIDAGISKAVRPSTLGKRNFSQIKSYKNKSQDAVKTIVENKSKLNLVDDAGNTVNRLPQTLDEFSQAIEQTKTTMFNTYDDLTKQTGQQGGSVDLGRMSDKLTPIIKNRAIYAKDPRVIQHAVEIQKRFKEIGKVGVKEADDLVKFYNNSLTAYNKNPTYDMANIVDVDALIVNNLRTSLDKTISSATGRNFQAIKNKYGSLKVIEKDVASRATVYGRQNIKGLADYTDIFSAGDAIRGIISRNPALIAKSILQHTAKQSIKKINDANNIVKNMFKQVDKFHEPIPLSITPEILGGKTIPVGGRQGLPYQQRLGLPSPRDVPYRGTGQRSTGQKPIILPSQQGQGVVYGQSPILKLPSPQTVSPDPWIHGKWFKMRR